MIYDPNSTEVNSDADVLGYLVNDTSEQMPLSLLPEPFKQMRLLKKFLELEVRYVETF